MSAPSFGPGFTLRLAPSFTVLVLLGPVMAGIAGVTLPAFGYLPILGGTGFTLAPFRDLAAIPGIAQSAALSFASALITAFCPFALVQLFVAA